jgi:hypothetical protein
MKRKRDMHFIPAFDTGWAFGIAILGIYTMIVGIPLTIAVESIIIRQILFNTEKLWSAFGVAVGINLVSGVIGLWLVFPYYMNRVDALSMALIGKPTEYYAIDPRVWRYLIGEIIIGNLILSILIEGILLTLIFRVRPSLVKIWLTAIGINFFSYLGLVLILAPFYTSRPSTSIPGTMIIAGMYCWCVYVLFEWVWGTDKLRDRENEI